MKIRIDSFKDYTDAFVMMEERYVNIKNETGRDKYKWMAEVLFEEYRKKVFPDMPSRMNGVFLTASIIESRKFKIHDNRVNASIYKCLLPKDKVYSFNMDIFTQVHVFLYTNKLKSIDDSQYYMINNMINTYWTESRFCNGFSEYLTEFYPIHFSFVE